MDDRDRAVRVPDQRGTDRTENPAGPPPLSWDPATTRSASLDRSTSVGMAADDKTSVWIWVGPGRSQAFSATLTASSSSRRPCSFCHCAKPGDSGVFHHVVKFGETAFTSVSETLRSSASRAAQSRYLGSRRVVHTDDDPQMRVARGHGFSCRTVGFQRAHQQRYRRCAWRVRSHSSLATWP